MNNTLVLTTTVLSATVAATLIALIFVFALGLTVCSLLLFRAGRRECSYRQRQVHDLIAESEVAVNAEARAIWQRDSLVKELDDAVADIAERDAQLRQWRLWATFTEEVVEEAVSLADLCKSQPVPAKSRNLLTAEKLAALTRLQGAVEAYHVHAANPENSQRKSSTEPSSLEKTAEPEDFEAVLDDWAAKYAPKPTHAKVYEYPEAGPTVKPGQILLGGRPAPVGRLDTITNRLVNTVRGDD